VLEELLRGGDASKADEIELLELLIDTWDSAHDVFADYDPVQLLQALMTENNLKQIELAAELGIGESYLSEILSYKNGFSRNMIRKLSDVFGVHPDAFRKNYELHNRKAGLKPYASVASFTAAHSSGFMVNEPEPVYEKLPPAGKTGKKPKE
jgi:HTH-type transcriptional regulator/antitoxin HigA